MAGFRDFMTTIIKVYSMTDDELAKRRDELRLEIEYLEELQMSDSMTKFEAMIIIQRLVEEGKMDIGNDIDKE